MSSDPTQMDPRVVAEARKQAKAALRNRLRALRMAIPAAARDARSRKLCERLLEVPALTRARAVALFWPLLDRGEVDLRPVDRVLRERGCRVLYPVVQPPGPGFAATNDAGELQARGGLVEEPLPETPLAGAGEVDLVVVPALAAAPTGHRLGYGSGFYDRVLPGFRPPATAVVVVFHFQLLAELPVDEHDVACDLVVTDEVVVTPSP